MPKLLRQQPGGVGQFFDAPMNVAVNGHASIDGKIILEVHESTCSHCQHITAFPSIKRMMDYVEICRCCMKLICLGCYDKMCRGEEGCIPYEERARRAELEWEVRARTERDGWRCY